VPLGVEDAATTTVATGKRGVEVLINVGVTAVTVALGVVKAFVAARAVTVIAAAVYASGVAF
jgi:hypothetical protein